MINNYSLDVSLTGKHGCTAPYYSAKNGSYE